MAEIIYLDIPPGANEEVTAEGQGQPFWDGQVSRTQAHAPYATLEPGYWRLDGTRRLLGGAADEGFCSRGFSNEKGEFSTPVALTITLPSRYTATGLTFLFDKGGEEWPTRLTAKWYRGDLLLAQAEGRPNASRFVLAKRAEAFDRIQVFFYSTLKPFRYLKLEQLQIGQVHSFGPDELKRVTQYTQTDVSGTTLPGGSLRFELNLKEEMQLAFQGRQTFRLYHKGKQLGVYYLDQASKTGPRSYTVSCMDAIGVLGESQTLGGLWQDIRFQDLAEEILDGEFPAVVHGDLANIPISGWVAAGTKREGLLQAAFSAGAVVKTDPAGRLVFSPVESRVRKTLTGNQIFTGGSVTVKPLVTRIQLTAKEYQPGERTTVHKEEMEPGRYLIMMKEPCLEYQCQGGSITQSGANYLRLAVEQPGQVTVTARPCKPREKRYLDDDPKTTPNDKSNEISLNGLTLMPYAKAEEALARLSRWSQNREIVRQTVTELELETGMLVTTDKAFDGQLTGYITSITLHLSGGGRAELEIQGRTISPGEGD